MDELLKNAPDIIKAAATNPLALAALVVLTLASLAFIHFRNAGEFTRLAVYVLTGLAFIVVFGVVLVGTVISDELARADKKEKSSPPMSTSISISVPEKPTVRTPDPALATICVTPEAICPFERPFLHKGSPCNCNYFGGLLTSSSGIAQ